MAPPADSSRLLSCHFGHATCMKAQPTQRRHWKVLKGPRGIHRHSLVTTCGNHSGLLQSFLECESFQRKPADGLLLRRPDSPTPTSGRALWRHPWWYGHIHDRVTTVGGRNLQGQVPAVRPQREARRSGPLGWRGGRQVDQQPHPYPGKGSPASSPRAAPGCSTHTSHNWLLVTNRQA